MSVTSICTSIIIIKTTQVACSETNNSLLAHVKPLATIGRRGRGWLAKTTCGIQTDILFHHTSG